MKVEDIRCPVSQHLVKYELVLRKLEYESEGEREQRGREREKGERQSKFELHRLELDHALELKKLKLAGRTDEGHPSMRPSSFDI